MPFRISVPYDLGMSASSASSRNAILVHPLQNVGGILNSHWTTLQNRNRFIADAMIDRSDKAPDQTINWLKGLRIDGELFDGILASPIHITALKVLCDTFSETSALTIQRWLSGCYQDCLEVV